MEKKKLIFVLLLAATMSVAAAKDFIYISPSGADNNVGNKRNPLKTIEAGLEHVRKLREKGNKGEIVIRLAAGTYYVAHTLKLNSIYSNVSIVGEGAEKTTISGGTRLKGSLRTKAKAFSFNPEGICIVNEQPEIFVNDRRMVLARTPNINHYYQPVEYSWKANNKSRRSGTVDFKLPSEAKGHMNAVAKKNKVIVSFLHEWCESRRFIKHYDVNQGIISMDDPINRSRQYFKRNGAKQFFLENDYSFLDAEGEYYFDKGKSSFYFIPYKNDKVISEIIVPVNNMLFKISGEREKPISNICFRDISFKHTSYKIPEGGEEPYQASSETSAAITLDYVKGIKFENCEFCHTGEFALWFRSGCHYSSIEHCYLHDLGGGGIKIGVSNSPLPADKEYEITRHVKVDNNIIREGGRILYASAGILLMQASDCIISHNDISDFFYTGISVGWTWGYGESPAKRNVIYNNHIHHLGWGALGDMGGVYTLGKSSGTVIKNNIIHHLYSMGDKAWGVYLDEGTSNIMVKENVVYECETAPFHLHYGRDNEVINNIFETNKSFVISKGERHTSIYFDKNIILTKGRNQIYDSSWDKSSVTRIPNIVWRVQNDVDGYREMTNDRSICINPGVVINKDGVYNVTQTSALRKIGFKMINTANVGVYGTNEWKDLAKFDTRKEVQFKKLFR